MLETRISLHIFAGGVRPGHLTRLRPGQAGPELMLWSNLCARSLRASSVDGETLHRDLSAQVERLSADLDPGEGIRHDAAVLILGRLRGVPLQYDNDLLSLTDDAGHAFDPFTTLYVLLALWREPTPNGQGLFGQVSGQLTDHLLGSQESSGGQRGSWAPREDLGDEPGRMARTAVNLVSVTIYYRYCKLLVTDS